MNIITAILTNKNQKHNNKFIGILIIELLNYQKISFSLFALYLKDYKNNVTQ